MSLTIEAMPEPMQAVFTRGASTAGLELNAHAWGGAIKYGEEEKWKGVYRNLAGLLRHWNERAWGGSSLMEQKLRTLHTTLALRCSGG
jgi:hypothetical protein